MTTIIITECQNPYGKYWAFKVKGSNATLVEVDRMKKGCGYAGYKVFAGEWLSEVHRTTKKDAALEFAKDCCRQCISDDVEFKWNILRERYSWA